MFEHVSYKAWCHTLSKRPSCAKKNMYPKCEICPFPDRLVEIVARIGRKVVVPVLRVHALLLVHGLDLRNALLEAPPCVVCIRSGQGLLPERLRPLLDIRLCLCHRDPKVATPATRKTQAIRKSIFERPERRKEAGFDRKRAFA